jgi:hypothetical protein
MNVMPPVQTADFPVSYDLTTKILSAVVIISLLAIAAFVHVIFIGCLAILAPILGFAYSPRGYSISSRTITVKRLMGNVEVPLEQVHEARRLVKDDLRGCIRVFGSGGFFGYYGLFRTTKLGKCTWYMTNRKNAVVLVAGPQTTLYSPDDVDAFLEAVRSQSNRS